VSFSQNVRAARGTIVRQTSAAPPLYLVELLLSFKGVKRVEMPEGRILAAEPEPHTLRRRGSRKSRRLSPTTLNAIVRLRMARPGNVAIHHWSR
jgi:hypothetical protein